MMTSLVGRFIGATSPLMVGALLGCAAQQPVAPPPAASNPPPAAAQTVTAATGSAKQCRTSRSYSGDTGFHTRMLVSSDGGHCSFDTDFVMSGRGANSGHRMSMSSGELTSQPQHGAAILHFENGVSSVDYTPGAGYVGPDQFSMHLLPSTRPWLVDVTVVK